MQVISSCQKQPDITSPQYWNLKYILWMHCILIFYIDVFTHFLLLRQNEIEMLYQISFVIKVYMYILNCTVLEYMFSASPFKRLI